MIRKRTQVRPNLGASSKAPDNQSQNSSNQLPSAVITAPPAEPTVPIQVSTLTPVPATTATAPTQEETQELPSQEPQVVPEVTITPRPDDNVQVLIQALNTPDAEPVQPLALKITSNKNVRMKDLLFYNPPMTAEQRTYKKERSALNKSKATKEKTIEQEIETQEESDHEQSIAPKVKIGLDGMMVLDESSTVINRKNTIRDQEAIVEDNDDLSSTNYSSFRRRPTSTGQTKWSDNDNRKFYRALSIVGPDFTLMEKLFFSGSRTRKELHKKFKREEKYNKLKVDLALTSKISVHSDDIPEIQNLIEEGV